jgi:hypothetical protein
MPLGDYHMVHPGYAVPRKKILDYAPVREVLYRCGHGFTAEATDTRPEMRPLIRLILCLQFFCPRAFVHGYVKI